MPDSPIRDCAASGLVRALLVGDFDEPRQVISWRMTARETQGPRTQSGVTLCCSIEVVVLSERERAVKLPDLWSCRPLGGMNLSVRGFSHALQQNGLLAQCCNVALH
jgi:hypothetical protein